MKSKAKDEVCGRSAMQRRGGDHPTPRVNISSQKLGFFRWRTSLPTLQTHKHIPSAKPGQTFTSPPGDDDARQERTVEEQRLIESIPKTTSFLRLSSVEPFVPFPGPEDPYLVQEILDHARNSYWMNLAVTRRPSETPHPSFQGESCSSDTRVST